MLAVAGPTTVLLESIGYVSHVSLVNTIQRVSHLSAEYDRNSKSYSVGNLCFEGNCMKGLKAVPGFMHWFVSWAAPTPLC